MKLSGKLMKKQGEILSCRSGLVTNSADRRLSASAAGGKRQTAIVAPGGIGYIPKPGEDAVMLTNDNEQLCLGVRMLKNDFEIEPGELVLYAGAASIILRKSGKIEINGEVYLNGERLEVES